MCMTFGYNPQINFCHFFSQFELNHFWAKTPPTIVCPCVRPCVLPFVHHLGRYFPNPFETFLLFLSRTEDVHDIWI